MAFDPLLQQIADYVTADLSFSKEAFSAARLSLQDALACALLSLDDPVCRQTIAPLQEGAGKTGVPIPGTSWRVNPFEGAFILGSMIRWLDFNDTWLAKEWGHPSDNFGGILSTADYRTRRRRESNRSPLLVRDVLDAAIRAYEIQGSLALENSLNQFGIDHVLFVRVATAAVVSKLLGGDASQICATLSHVFVDGGPLRCYRHAPNVCTRKSWAAGDACRRALQIAWLVRKGTDAAHSPLTAPEWGLEATLLRDGKLQLSRKMHSYVVENILYKVSFPVEFHAQTAVEAAVKLHPLLEGRLEKITQIEIATQKAAKTIIDKSGSLSCPADRDHCIQYAVAVALIKGTLEAEDFQDRVAADPLIDQLRGKMRVYEEEAYSVDYHDSDKRSCANRLLVELEGGERVGPVEVEYPIGHVRRREEAIPLLQEKFVGACHSLSKERRERLAILFREGEVDYLPVDQLMELLI